MHTASVQELKQSLRELPPAELTEICLRLARFKKENKELLHYLLLGSIDPDAYRQEVEEEIRQAFAEVNRSNLYFAKKSIRKILRIVNRHIKYMATRESEAALLLYFCRVLQDSDIRFRESTALLNLYQAQLKKAEKAISGMHEDLQYDYLKMLRPLQQAY